MRLVIPLFRIILVLLTSTLTVNADDRGINVVNKSDQLRTALVIGNSTYKDAPLKNPANDARGIANILKQKGFDVTLALNAPQREMEEAIRQFGKKLRRGGVGLFYYAGHGIQINGRNYLIPIGAVIESESDVKYESVDAGLVLGKMEDASNGANIVILDACRNNPFARSFRSANKGLARMDAPKGSIIAYATAPGSVAKDGEGLNGTYTKYLMQNIRVPGLSIEEVFKRVRTAVVKETGTRQVPWESSSLMGNFYFSQPSTDGKVESPKTTVYTSRQIDDEEEMWLLVKDSESVSDVELFLKNYPNGRFSAHAKLLRNHLKSPPPPTNFPTKRETSVTTSSILKDYELLYVKFFEGGKTAPEAKDRQYKDTFYKSMSRYIYTEVKVNNLQYNGKQHSHAMVFLYYNPDNTLRGRIEGTFNVNPEWATAWIYRGWGWADYGEWPTGTYRVEVFMDGKRISTKKFSIAP